MDNFLDPFFAPDLEICNKMTKLPSLRLLSRMQQKASTDPKGFALACAVLYGDSVERKENKTRHRRGRIQPCTKCGRLRGPLQPRYCVVCGKEFPGASVPSSDTTKKTSLPSLDKAAC